MMRAFFFCANKQSQKGLSFHTLCNNIDVTETIERTGEQPYEHSRILPRFYRERGSA